MGGVAELGQPRASEGATPGSGIPSAGAYSGPLRCQRVGGGGPHTPACPGPECHTSGPERGDRWNPLAGGKQAVILPGHQVLQLVCPALRRDAVAEVSRNCEMSPRDKHTLGPK